MKNLYIYLQLLAPILWKLWPNILFFLTRVNDILGDIKAELAQSSFVGLFRLNKLRDVLEKLRELTEQLVSEL